MTDPSALTTERSEADVRARVLEMIVELAPDADGTYGPETLLVNDLGYHSLALMELAFALEDEFDLDPIDEKTARTISTVGNVQDVVLQRLQERG